MYSTIICVALRFGSHAEQDWFLGSSWALGIPTLGGVPYANGRNQESSSEAVNAYDAIALYGHVMAQVRSATKGDEVSPYANSLGESPRLKLNMFP